MRKIIPGIPHHIILRGNNRRRLFSYPSDYKRFLWDLERARERAPCDIHAFNLMKNHTHFVLTPPDEGTLSKMIQLTAQRYAQVRNLRRETTGKLFEERFISIPIETERQLAITLAYVDMNAVRAGVVRDPLDWPWSTYALHAGVSQRSVIPPSLWTPSQWYLDLAADEVTRGELYVEWARECVEHAELERAEKIRSIERLSSTPYTRRLRRPNGRLAM